MSRSYPFLQASVTPATASVLTNAQNKVQQSKQNIMFDENKERIKKMFTKVELSVSSYDTAWLAMIKSPSSPQAPLFPQSLNWLLENQQNDGSWALSDDDRHELLTKDSLLSLACVLALKQWGVGEQQITKGLEYIESNIGSAYDDQQYSPIGFDIIFSHLFEQVQKLDLNLPLGGKHLESLIRKRELELKRGWAGSNSEGRKAYLTYISEGLGRSQDWEMAMKYQRKNGSLFNSPAATANAFTHLNNTQCFDYLLSLVDKFGHAVPTLDPFDVYARIYMVDNLKKLGIDRHFKEEIQTVLDQTYRSWQQEEDDIFLEPTTCAMAFRLLSLHGYDISSDALSRFSKDKFCNTLQGYLKDVDAVSELHKASQIVLHPNNDSVLHELYSWTGSFLDEYLSSPLNHISHEVRFAVRYPHHTYLDCLLNQRSIEHYKVDLKRTLKTSYSCSNLSNKEFLELAVEDLNKCQSIFREEFKQYQRWFKESGMDKLEFPRAKVAYCYIAAIVGNDSPELSEARLSWAKNGLILSIVDDLFDVWGTEEEQINLVKLLENWDVDVIKECCSERVKILFSALKGIICEVEDQAFKIQGRSVLSHVIQIWVDLLRSFTKEAEWEKTKCVPMFDEYLPNSMISFAVGVLIPGLYLMGPKLPNEIIQSDEFKQLYETLSLFGRLLNDINGYQREKEQGKLINSITVELMHGSGGMSEVEIIEKLQRTADEKRKEVLRLVVKEQGSIVPRDVKDLFWNWCKLFHLFYKKDDVLHANDLADEFMISFKHVLGHS